MEKHKIDNALVDIQTLVENLDDGVSSIYLKVADDNPKQAKIHCKTSMKIAKQTLEKIAKLRAALSEAQK